MKNSTNSLCLALCLTVSSTAVIATFTGCAGDRYNRSTGQYIDDKSISSRVNSALNDNPEYKFDDVSITTFRGTVQLSGFVDTSDQKSKAVEIAKQIQGVRKVVNGITVKSGNEATGEYVDDKSLNSRVGHALSDNPEYKFDGVNVNSYEGLVQLSGFVDTAGQKTQAGEITKQIQGVREVMNNITVKDKMNQ